MGKTHLSIGLGIKACHAGYPVAFDTATGWAHRLAIAHNTADGLAKELKRLRRYQLLIIDELGYLHSTHKQRTCSSNSSSPATNKALS